MGKRTPDGMVLARLCVEETLRSDRLRVENPNKIAAPSRFEPK
jgi:hypothetical protein